MKSILKMLPTMLLHFATLLNFLNANFIEDFVVFSETETKDYFITKCIVEISKRELYWRSTVVLENNEGQSIKKTVFNDDIIKMLSDEKVPYVITENINIETINTTEATYLAIEYLETCDEIKNFDFNKIRGVMKFLIAIKNSNDNCTQNFQDVAIAYHDISVFLEKGSHIFELYTFLPEIDFNSCEVTVGKPVNINTCNKGKLVGNDTFPVKSTTNFNKCPIKIGIGPLYPFATIVNKNNKKTYDRMDDNDVIGMDIQLLKIILNNFNATIDLYYIHKIEENALLDKKFIELVQNGSLEICAGGLYRIYGDVVEYSGVYARQKISWLYYAERNKKTWETLVPNIEGLHLFMVFYFSYSAVLYLISMFDKTSVSVMRILLFSWGSLVGSTSLLEARTTKQKILNAVYLIMSLHLAVYINIQLYSFFTIQDPPVAYKTNDALMNSGIVPYLQPFAKYFVNDEKYIRFANTSKDCMSFDDCAKVSEAHKGMTVLIEDFAIHFQVETAVNNEVRMLIPAESLLTVYYEMIIKKGHPIVKKFQKTLERLIEAGIPGKILTEAVGTTIVTKADIGTRNLLSKSYNCQQGCTLSFEQLGGVFYIVIYGCVASSIIFIVEILSYRQKKHDHKHGRVHDHKVLNIWREQPIPT